MDKGYRQIKVEVEALEAMNKHSNEIIKEKSKQLKNLMSKLTKEEKKKIKRFQARVDQCVKNNDVAGLAKLKTNFK